MPALIRGGLFLCLASTFFFACSQSPSVLKGAYPSGASRYEIAVDSKGRKHGPETWWFDNGQRRYQTNNFHGIRDGEYRAWYPNGNLWYQGTDSLGIQQDTLFAWRQDGGRAGLRIFQSGLKVYEEAVDASGLSRGDKQRIAEEDRQRAAAAEIKARDSLQELDRVRRNSLNMWSHKVRTTVEAYWVPPKTKGSVPYRAVARIRVRSDGLISKVTWVEKSSSRAFNETAAKALRLIRRFPSLPPEVGTDPVEVRYEFQSLRSKPPVQRLHLRAPVIEQDEPDSTSYTD